jgi:hypothetical protein
MVIIHDIHHYSVTIIVGVAETFSFLNIIYSNCDYFSIC